MVVESSNLIKGLLAKLAVAFTLVASIAVTFNLPSSGLYVNGELVVPVVKPILAAFIELSVNLSIPAVMTLNSEVMVSSNLIIGLLAKLAVADNRLSLDLYLNPESDCNCCAVEPSPTLSTKVI